ncbi:MAG: hypothetical protein IH830_07565 [Planctomycetes bacterium]|nr:hypothetical protein [Planctomycetota bacterium]
MRWFVNSGVLVIVSLATPLLAQTTLDYPVGERQPYHYDSGFRPNQGEAANVVSEHLVRVDGAAWLRLYFGDVELEPGSFVRITSQLDNEIQELDARGLAMWSNSSAYFNGDSVYIELVAAAKTRRNRILINEVARAMAVHPVGGCAYPCGICGADNRVASDEDWSGRLFPVGCTASVWNTDSCLVSAGHCITGGLVIQFNVPNSNPNCSTNNPPVADQFPITAFDFLNGGVGNDWAVMTTGTNNLGQTIFGRYGVLRPIASSPPVGGQSVGVWGFGIDNQCTLSQTQQTDSASVNSVSGMFFTHTVDITCGSSGSAVIRNGEILGIVTHCPCPGAATRMDRPLFVTAREELCGGPPEGACCFDDGTCTVDTESGCNAVGGSYQGDGSNCSPNLCPQPTGACCFADGTCTVDTQSGCTAVGGSYQGDDISCSPKTCPLPSIGACCVPDNFCVETTPNSCSGLNGTYQGDGTTCLPDDPCVPLTGACCVPDGSCGVVTLELCDLVGGNYQGDGSDCSPNPCPPPTTGACCFNDGSCQDGLTDTDCPAAGGTYQGDGSVCAKTFCRECEFNGDCDDGNECNGLETCVGGICQPGIPLDCDDGNPCTDDDCSGGDCINTNNFATCDDGNVCTESDACDAGVCAGEAIDNCTACDQRRLCRRTGVPERALPAGPARGVCGGCGLHRRRRELRQQQLPSGLRGQ